MSETKLCKDCKHCRRGIMFFFDQAFWKCVAPSVPTIVRLTDGKVIKKKAYADLNRSWKDECGPEGKWFEPR